MTTISAAAVKELRELTNVGMMECKKALVEAGGDRERAIQLLRERGLAMAGKRAAREAKSGIIAARTAEDGRSGAMVEVNCETDFVARNESFQAFVQEMLEKAMSEDGELADRVKDEVAGRISEIGENIIVRRNARYTVQGEGLIATYIHLGSKVGVLLELGAEKPESAGNPAVQELARDLTLHVAASRPDYLSRADVPAEVIEQEKAIFAKQVEGKPAQIIDKIVSGKIDKYYGQVCCLEQGFVKDTDQTIEQVLAAAGKAAGDTLTLRRFVRYQLGE